MWKAFRFLLVILVLAASGAWLVDHPGEFVVTWYGYRIETSFTLVATLLAFFMALLFWAYRVTVRTIGGPAALIGYYGNRRKTKGQEALRQGLVAVAAGNPAEVRKLAARANALLNDPPMTLLLTAQAAQLEGDDKRATKAFRKMLDNPETEFLGLRGLFLQSARNGNRLEALGLAERAFELQPETPWVFNALFELQTAIGEWSSAAKTLEKSVAAKHIDSAVAKRRRAVLFTEQAIATPSGEELSGDENWSLKAADLSPSLVPAAVLAAQHHIREGDLLKAAKVVEKTWVSAPHPDLVPVYVEARMRKSTDEDQGARDIKADAKWLKGLADFNAGHIESRLLRAGQDLVLGRARAARKSLKGLSEGYATARVCKLMADIEAAEGRDEAARDWLARIVSAPRDAHWMCETCGRESPSWTSTCNNCGAFDTLSWKAPADLVAGLVLDPVEPEAQDSAKAEGAEVGSKGSATIVPEKTEPATIRTEPLVIDIAPEDISIVEPEAVPSDAPPADKPPGALAGTPANVPASAPANVGASNPLARESVTGGQGASEDLEDTQVPVMAPVVDDPGPGGDDPFAEDEERW